VASNSTSRGYDVLISDLNKLINSERAMIAAVNSVLVKHKTRIFQEGLAANNSKIGDYSTKPTYISVNRQAKNVGKTKFEGGYREYKTLLGKGGGALVNLRDTDQMMFDLGTTVSKNEYGIGFNNDFNADKSKWMEDKFNKDIFITSDQEDELFVRVVQAEIERL
jgi:hypothetical protein